MRHLGKHMLVLGSLLMLTACGGGGGDSSSPPPTTTGGATVTVSPTTGGTASVSSSTSSSTLNFNFPANAVSSSTTVTVSSVASSALPAPLSKAVNFTPNSQNTYVTAFKIDAQGVTLFNVPVSLSGNVSTTVASGTVLNMAIYSNNTWEDVSTVTVGANGVFTQSLASTTLPGIIKPGTYLIYKPATGTSTALANYGVVLIADDGNGTYGTPSYQSIQVINIFDSNGKPLTTPTIKYLSYPGAYDIDGAALTPDGSQGIVVDGGNTVRFFSGVQTGSPVASTTTLPTGQAGSDGDSVAIMPNGDEAVVAAEGSNLLVVSGIASGNPKAAELIPVSSVDGVVISNDGKVLLARAGANLTVFSIASITPKTGSLGGTISHSFTQIKQFTTLGYGPTDGRNGMTISPTDSSRALVSSSNKITLLTGLTGSTPTAGTPLTISGAYSIYSVSITPDGTSAVIGTEAGIILVKGINTGTLQQVGTAPYAPSYTRTSGASVTLAYVKTLGITLDGNYVVACDGSNSALLVIPFSSTAASGFGSIAGKLNDVAVPDNDQLLIH